MSDATKVALEEALQAHVSDEFTEHFDGQVMVSGYVCKIHVVSMTSTEDISRYLFVRPDNQPYHETYGLLLTAQDDFVTTSSDDD